MISKKTKYPIYTHQFRVYYEDTDAGGVMYHAKYLNFFERTRTEWLRSKGIEQRKLAEQHNIIFAIRSMDIQYIKPARLDDLLSITTEAREYKNASMSLVQTLSRGAEILATATVRVASIRADSFTPVRFPEHLKQEIMS